MGWIMHDQPGTELGPCAKKCAHKDCEATRQDVAALCRCCKKPIGYGTKFYMDQAPTKSGWSYVHFLCALKLPEPKQKKAALAALNDALNE